MEQSPPRFQLLEALAPDEVTRLPMSTRQIDDSHNYRMLLIRLLIGTLDFRCCLTERVVAQRKNYAFAGYRDIEELTHTSLLKSTEHFFAATDLEAYLSKPELNNQAFFRELLSEFLHCFLEEDKGNHAMAFLHLYRALESMAYALPLIWASRAKDYKSSFDSLRSYFTDPKIGELKVFDHFLRDIIDSEEVYDAHAKINIESMHPDWQQKYFTTIKSIFDEQDIYEETPHAELDVKFGSINAFAINCRNRYFHFLTGRGGNLSSQDIPDPDEFFLCINKPLLNWLSVLLFEVFEHEANS